LPFARLSKISITVKMSSAATNSFGDSPVAKAISQTILLRLPTG
jgi:hypothetical protein